jgi:flagellar biosynthesis component FlhA
LLSSVVLPTPPLLLNIAIDFTIALSLESSLGSVYTKGTSVPKYAT